MHSMLCRYCRHPGYLGWFVWAVGTQLLLVNPLCLTGFSYVVGQDYLQCVTVALSTYQLRFLA